MKKLLLFIILIASFGNAQTISPSEANQYCPKQPYSFTINLPGNFITVNTSGGVYVYPVSGSGTSITISAEFADVSGAQNIIVSYQGGEKTFRFTKIKSLFGGYKVGPNTITNLVVPICQTTPVQLNIVGDQYQDVTTNPISSFGSITNYKYLIPTGWKLNGITSNGSNWISASNSVTLTPTADSGNGSVIQYIAKSDCSGAFFEGTPKFISISRPAPVFTLSPSSVTFECGTQQTKTFTVSSSTALSCPTGYLWNLGPNNGWYYNGGSAPSQFSTSTNSITLTSASPFILPSTVHVTPVVNGVNYPQLHSPTAFTAFTSTASLSGDVVICPGHSAVYTISGLEAGNTVSWSMSNPAYATVSNGTQGQVTVTGIAEGLTDLIATITNSCGQVVTKVKHLNIGAPVLPNGIIYGELWVRKNFYPIMVSFPAVLGAESYSWEIVPGGDFPPVCPTSGANPAKFGNGLQTMTTSTPNVSLSVGNCLGQYEIICTLNNHCGSAIGYIRYLTVGNSGSSPCFDNNVFEKAFSLSPNPVTQGAFIVRKNNAVRIAGGTVDNTPAPSIVDGDDPCFQEWPKPAPELNRGGSIADPRPLSEIEVTVMVYDFLGKQVYTKTVSATEEITIDNLDLLPGQYIVKIADGLNEQNEIIIVE